MRTQRNMSQMKEQNKTPDEELNKMETSKLSEFKIWVIKMLNELGRRKDELSDNFNKEKTKIEVENIKRRTNQNRKYSN